MRFLRVGRGGNPPNAASAWPATHRAAQGKGLIGGSREQAERQSSPGIGVPIGGVHSHG
jgi:hypothetical protein